MTSATLAQFILVILLLEYLLERTAGMLNDRRRFEALPQEFEDTIAEDDYQRSRNYGHAHHRVASFQSSFDLAILLLFWRSGGFAWLQNSASGITEHWLLQGLLYIAAIVVAKGILALPFDVYQTFWINQRFEMNNTDWKTFVADQLKGLLLMAVIGGAMLGLVLWCFHTFAASAPLWGWIGISVLLLALQYIAPTWIMPLFNKFSPLENGELRDAIMEFASKSNFPVQDVMIADGSRRSKMSNAYLTGFGKKRRIVLYDTLIDSQPTNQIVAVLAHEIGHFRHKHILQRLVMGILNLGVTFYLLSLVIHSSVLAGAFGLGQQYLHTGLVFFMIVYSPVSMLLSLILNHIARLHEYQADAFAASNLSNPEDMVRALKTLYKENLANLNPHPLVVWLHADHPGARARIQGIRSIIAK